MSKVKNLTKSANPEEMVAAAVMRTIAHFEPRIEELREQLRVEKQHRERVMKDMADMAAGIVKIIERYHCSPGFADKLTRLLAAKGISQIELAEKIGIGQPAISNMLSRNCRPHRRTVLRIAKALEMEPSELWPPRD